MVNVSVSVVGDPPARGDKVTDIFAVAVNADGKYCKGDPLPLVVATSFNLNRRTLVIFAFVSPWEAYVTTLAEEGRVCEQEIDPS
jgi:hypothetical protein